MGIRIIVADDHHVLRLGVISLLEMEGGNDFVVVGEVASGAALFDAVQALKPDVILLDICMADFDARIHLRELQHVAGDAKLLILTAHDEPAYVDYLTEAGAAGYLLKDDLPITIVEAVRAVAQGESWFSPQVGSLAMRSV